MVNGRTRLATRFCGDAARVDAARAPHRRAARRGRGAASSGLVTFAPDDLDWDDEMRLAIEERASLSPDALTGMEANLRFAGAETMETRDLRPPVGLAELDLHPARTPSASRAR